MKEKMFYAHTGGFDDSPTQRHVGTPVAGTPQTPEIPRLVSHIAEQLGALHDAISALDTRLAPVSTPTPHDTESHPTPTANTELGQHLQNTSDALANAVGRLGSICDSLGL